MDKTNIFKRLFLLFGFVLFMPVLVLANNKITLDVSKTDLTIGDEVVVKAIVQDKLDSYALLATLKYDQNVFEKLEEDDFKVSDTLSVTFNKDNNKFGLINTTGEIENDVLFEVQLRVKGNANVGDTNIALTNISSSDGNGKEEITSISTKVFVSRDAKEGEEVPINQENEIKEDKHEVIQVFSNRFIEGGALAGTGLLLGSLIFLIIKKRGMKIILITSASTAVFGAVSGTLLYLDINKKDVNNDGVKDYNDAQNIVEYLIDLENTKEDETDIVIDNTTDSNSDSNSSNSSDNKENKDNNSSNSSKETNSSSKPSKKPDNKYDTNNDGKVDVEDIGDIVSDVTKKTKVKLSSISDSQYYVNKGTIMLDFKAEISPASAKLKKVKVDGKLYDVVYNEDHYAVSISETKAGIHNFEITEALVDNGQTVKTNLVITREVLKDIPYVNDFDLNDKKKTLSFNLVDPDEAFIEGEVIIYEGDSKVITHELNKDTTNIDLKDLGDKTYDLVIRASFDVDSRLNDNKNYFENEAIFSHSFHFGGDYNFTLTDASITDALQPGEVPVVSFKSTNAREAVVANANLTIQDENKSYNISLRDGNNYEVRLEGADTSIGKHTVTLENVGLDSLKTFYNNKDYKTNDLVYTVLKEAPKVENIKASDDNANKKINVTFDLIDSNKATTKLYAVLVDSLDKIVTKVELNPQDYKNGKVSTSLSYANNVDGFYKIQVLADYELSDKYIYSNKNLGETYILTHVDDIYISKMFITNDSNAETNNIYPNKKQKNYQIAFEVYIGDSINAYANSKHKANYSQVSSVTVNGLNYPASKMNNLANKSKIYLSVPSTAGKLELKANRVQLTVDGYYKMYSTDMYSVLEKKLTIDVLKDKPKIDNLIIVDDYDKDQVTFNFDVVLDETATEDEFTDGLLSIDDQTHEIHAGKNIITFDNITKDKNMDVIFSGSYDLDSTKDNNLNETKNGELLKIKYGLFNKETYNPVEIIDGKIISNLNNKYFEKKEKIKLSFNVSNIDPKLEASVSKVVIDNNVYPITKLDNGYELILDGYLDAGKKDITITKVILSNGKEILLTKAYTFNPEVLKDALVIDDYKYEDGKDEIKASFSLKDLDKALVGSAKVVITDSNGKMIYNDVYKSSISFKKESNVLRYYVKVIASYDRDTDTNSDSENHYTEAVLLDEIISLEENNIEFKDIIDINLYEEVGEDEIVLVNNVKVNDIESNKDKYFVEVVMSNLPTIRVRIKSVVTTDDILTLVLEYKYVTLENTNRTQTIRIDYGSIKDGLATNEFHPKDAFLALLAKLEHGDDVTLNRNYDASTIKTDNESYVVNEYKGHLNGNGYIIENLDRPLFNNLDGAKIENVKIETVTMSSTAYKGVLANTAKNSTVKGVLINNVKKTNCPTESGLLIGSVISSKISESRVTNFTMSDAGGYPQLIGSLVGRLDSSTVENCYAEGTLSASWNYVSGFVGNAINNSQLINNYSKVTYGNWATTISCSFACGDNTLIAKNNLDLSKTDSRITKFTNNMSSESTNNYYLLGENEVVNKDGVITISSDEINLELFNKAHFDLDIWDLNDISSTTGAKFNVETKTKLEKTSGYDKSKETLYKNLLKLAPFYDNNKIIEEAVDVNDNLLLTEEITHIVPINKGGQIVTYLTTDNPKNISKIIVIFKNGKKAEYKVTYDKIYDMVVTYKVGNLNIDYNYNHYVINSNSQVVNNLTNYLKGLNYTNNLDILTTNDDSRIYRDFYNDVTKNELKEFVLKYLSNSNFTNTSSDEAINNYIEREVKKDKKIEKALYTYNYFRRFYDLDVDGMKIYDFVLFNMQGFNNSLNIDKITDLYFSDASGANFNTNETNTRYNNLLSTYTGLKNVTSLLDFIVTHVSNHNMDDWAAEQFKGILVEIPIKGHENDIYYTLWDHLSTEDDEYKGNSYLPYNFALPILTLPETAAYIISGPSQFTIGAQRVYMSNPTDPNELAAFKVKMQSYVDRIDSYYNTIYSIIQDKKIFNDIHLYQVDKRTTKNENGASVYNTPYSTTEPFHKNFDEVVGIWPASYGVNAGNWGDRIEWNAAGFMDSTLKTDGTLDDGHVTYKTFTHESAHYLDDRLFLLDHDRRFDAGGEDYADAFFMQSFEKFGIVMNLSINFNKDLPIGSNLTPTRINSEEKIHDFYDKAFQTIYTIDYIEALAFLQLDANAQKELGVQVSYPNENAQFEKDKEGNLIGKTYIEDEYARYRARETTRYTQLSEIEDFDYSKLKTIYDLIDNRIMLYPSVYKVSSRGNNSYGGEGYNVVHWYQPNNPYGRPDSYSLKWLSYEMLGYGGYRNGLVLYASNINSKKQDIYTSLSSPYNSDGKPNLTKVDYKSDSMAIKDISHGQFEDIDSYKIYRFKEIEKNLAYLNAKIDVSYYVQQFYDALLKDSVEMPANVQSTIKKYGSEKACLDNYWGIREIWADRGYTHSSEVRFEIYNTLKNLTHDFTTDEIYMKTIQQDVSNITVTK